MPVVLVPTDDMMIIPGITSEYSRRGFEVVVGKQNFFLGLHAADLVHYQWPEEFSDWKLPSDETIDRISRAVRRWADRCPTAVSVNNFYPHGFEGHPVFKRLYEVFYAHCKVVVHYSRTSHAMVIREFPSAGDKRHVVTPYFNYDRLLRPGASRDECRRSLGFQENEFVVLAFGAIRFREELQLIRRAFSMARIPHKRLLMCSGYWDQGSVFLRRLRSIHASCWRRWHRVRGPFGRIPDSEVHRYLMASDVLLIPRLKDMTSGLVGLAYTFARLMIAPNHGAHPEYLDGTDNLLYESGSPRSLAKAIERARDVDPGVVALQNRRRADEWAWDKIIGPCVDAALGPHVPRVAATQPESPRLQSGHYEPVG